MRPAFKQPEFTPPDMAQSSEVIICVACSDPFRAIKKIADMETDSIACPYCGVMNACSRSGMWGTMQIASEQFGMYHDMLAKRRARSATVDDGPTVAEPNGAAVVKTAAE